jgi:hypothetical protein
VNFLQLIGNVIFQHVIAAILINWKTTACGIAIAVFNDGPTLAAFFSLGWDHVDWGKLGAAVGTIAFGILARDFNVGVIFGSAPRAQGVAVKPVGIGPQPQA